MRRLTEGTSASRRRRTTSVRRRVVGAAVLLIVAAMLATPAGAAGFFGPRTYLLLGQNSAELRPYGGFIGVYGEVVLRWGRVVDVAYGDSLDLDGVYEERLASGEIPKPFSPHHLYAPSESPDFPTVARSAVEIYRRLVGVRADGVIALDPAVASALLGVLGPVAVPGEEEAITAANVLGLVLKHTQQFPPGPAAGAAGEASEAEDDGETGDAAGELGDASVTGPVDQSSDKANDESNDETSSADRKQFVYSLGTALALRARALPVTRWPAVARALARAAGERHIQVHVEDPALRFLARALGWDGAFPPPSDDFLAVVDSNVGYNKANLVTDQALDYRVVVAPDGGTTAALTVTYHNRGTAGLSFSATEMPYLHQAAYSAQVRLYVPTGSRRLSIGQGQRTWSELQRTVFEEPVTAPADSRRTLTVAYRLPHRRVEARRIRYDLLVRKQAGTGAVPFRLSVVPPAGWRVSPALHAWTAEAILDVDRRFSVEFEPASSGGS